MHHIKRRIEITTVTEQTVTVRPTSVRAYQWCAKCGDSVSMMTPDQAAVIARVFMRTIFQWVENGQVHFTETEDGKLLVCLNSLLQHTATPPAPDTTMDVTPLEVEMAAA